MNEHEDHEIEDDTDDAYYVHCLQDFDSRQRNMPLFKLIRYINTQGTPATRKKHSTNSS